MSLHDREERLQVHAGSDEHAFTLELRLMCPADPRHHVGTIRSNRGSGWRLEITPSETSTRATRVQLRAANQTASAATQHPGAPESGALFSLLGEALEPSDNFQEPVTPVGAGDYRRKSILRLEADPSTRKPRRLRWQCCHCAEDWQRTNRRGRQKQQDGILKYERIGRLLQLMRNNGPSTLRVVLDAAEIERITQEVANAAPNGDA